MTAPPERAWVRGIEAGILAYTALAAAAGWWFRDARFALGVVGGGAITYLNFLVVAGLVGRVLREQKKRWGLAYGAKSLLLFGAIVALLYFKAVDGLPLLLGLLSLFAAVLAAAGVNLVKYPGRKGDHPPAAEE